MSLRRFRWALGLLLLGGCYHPNPYGADQIVCNLASHVRDPEPPVSFATPPVMPPTVENPGLQPTAAQSNLPALSASSLPMTLLFPVPLPPPRRRPLFIPPELPGANAPPIRWPATREERVRETLRLYPQLPPLPEGP